MPTRPAALLEAPPREDTHLAPDLLDRAIEHARRGEVSAALAGLEAIRSRHEERLEDRQRVALLTTLIDCRLARGELDRAITEGDALRPLLDQPGLVGATAHFGRGELSAALGDTESAFGHYARAGALAADHHDRHDHHEPAWRASAALAAVRMGRRAEAVVLAREHVGLARETGSPYALAQGLRTLATVDMHTDRTASLREAREALATTTAARLAAQIDTDLAGLLLLAATAGPAREESAREALRLLRGAEEYAGREELWPLQSRIRRLLDRLGEPARPMLGEALAVLTAAEGRVARLAAAGLTNRQIAGELVITVKSVEWHLSRVYRKLGVRSRGALAGSVGAD